MNKSIRFKLDTPVDRELRTVSRFSGWCFDVDEGPATSVILSVNGQLCCQLLSRHRIDVGKAFPDYPYASASGFVGDLVLADDIRKGDIIDVEISVTLADGTSIIGAKRTYTANPSLQTFSKRPTSYELADILSGDTCYGIIAGTPHYHDTALPMIRLLESGATHNYGELALKLISEIPTGGLFLDFGCGIKSSISFFPNAVLLDAVHFPGVDIVNSSRKLPFRDETFDFIVSQAVFEHLADPGQVMHEFWRVLKPRGRVLIDTAFMQPLHGDPDHYNNMTLSALKRLMQGFTIEQEGVQPYQMPSLGLIMQIEAVLPFMRKGQWKSKLSNLLRDLKEGGVQLDRDLGPIGQKTLAAGIFVVARKVQS